MYVLRQTVWIRQFRSNPPPIDPIEGGVTFFSKSIICYRYDVWYLNERNLGKFVSHKTFLNIIAKHFIESSIFSKFFEAKALFWWKLALFRRNLYILQWFEIRTFQLICLKTVKLSILSSNVRFLNKWSFHLRISQ